MANPYSGLPDHQFWRRSISSVAPHEVDPVVDPRFRIGQSARVATGGSCFAQHISRRLSANGFNYFVPESGSELSDEVRQARHYGVFSARYGNVYTTAQLRQLMEEALGLRRPLDRAWTRPDGRLVDPLRPQIEPAGFATAVEVVEDRARHLRAVRSVLFDSDIFIFTLGLTEAWRSREDGTVFPLAPGVAAGDYDPARHEFVNFDVEAVAGDLFVFLAGLKTANPKVKVILTVSPVPLIATFEPRSVLSSTVYSKSVLRVVADMAIRRHDWVDYFPSYEIVTGSHAGARYYEDDAREVNHLGVAHAMRCFFENYIEGQQRSSKAVPTTVAPSQTGLICDEEMIDSVRA
jgi:hypothetical protein